MVTYPKERAVALINVQKKYKTAKTRTFFPDLYVDGVLYKKVCQKTLKAGSLTLTDHPKLL